MSSNTAQGIDLTASQQLILQELTTLHRSSESPVKGEEIADGLGRNPGTIRNQMQSLKALQLVEGIPGPHGGYKPTAAAYDVLTLQDIGEPARTPLYHDGEAVEETVVEEISLTSVLDPDNCQAEVSFQVSVSEFEEGDDIRAGPTPCTDLRVEGTVEAVDDLNSTLVVAVDSIVAPAGQASP